MASRKGLPKNYTAVAGFDKPVPSKQQEAHAKVANQILEFFPEPLKGAQSNVPIPMTKKGTPLMHYGTEALKHRRELVRSLEKTQSLTSRLAMAVNIVEEIGGAAAPAKKSRRKKAS